MSKNPVVGKINFNPNQANSITTPDKLKVLIERTGDCRKTCQHLRESQETVRLLEEKNAELRAEIAARDLEIAALREER